MKVLYHIRQYFVGIFPYIGLKNRPKIYGRYLQWTGSWNDRWFIWVALLRLWSRNRRRGYLGRQGRHKRYLFPPLQRAGRAFKKKPNIVCEKLIKLIEFVVRVPIDQTNFNKFWALIHCRNARRTWSNNDGASQLTKKQVVIGIYGEFGSISLSYIY